MNYRIISKYNVPSAVENVLLNRGIKKEDIPAYINPSSKEVFSPYYLANIEDAAKELVKTLLKQQKIYVQIDSDCDGYTSSALLLNYLHRVFPASVENLITYAVHDKKHHGINMNNIKDDIKLVVVPDASSNEVDFHQELANRGIATIILDHHHADMDNIDPAIIVNNQMCDYPNKMLSGVGIVYKFCKVLDKILQVSYADDYLDLVALGMIADMMDLRELETRFYTVEGLKEIRNPFFVEMVKKNEFKIKNELNSFTVSWYVAPFINAMTRSGSLEEKRTLFRSMLEYEAYKLVPSTKRGCSNQEELLVEQAVRICGNVKNRQEKEKGETLDLIYKAIKEQNQENDPIIIIKIEQSLDNNLNGLMANQIMAEFQKPVLILTKRNKDNIVTWEGSARGFAMDDIPDWRKYIENSGYALYAEGHPFAFGVGFTPENLIGFKSYVIQDLAGENLEPIYDVDFIWNAQPDIDKKVLEIADHKDLWGQGVSEPMVAVRAKLTAQNFALMGKGTLKITLPYTQTTCIKFGFGEDKYEELMRVFNNSEAAEIIILGYCRKNEWNGNISPQIEIKNYEITNVMKWLF